MSDFLESYPESIKTWTMRDGTTIAIKDMTPSHLANSIAMLKRNFEAAELPSWVMIDDIYPSYRFLKEELASRLPAIDVEENISSRRFSLLELE